VEKQAGADGAIQFELLAIGDNGKIDRPEGEASVVGEILGEGRAPKILVFHFKRKKQYKKLNGHRQPFTTVRIAEITYNGHTVKAPEVPATKPVPAAKNAAPDSASAEKAAE
jgi:large subunit ribosomal protein L21